MLLLRPDVTEKQQQQAWSRVQRGATCSGSACQERGIGRVASSKKVVQQTEQCMHMAQVLVVPILAGASGKAHVKPLTYVSALVALAGVGLLVEKGGVIMPGAGDLWSLLSAVFFGIQARPRAPLAVLSRNARKLARFNPPTAQFCCVCSACNLTVVCLPGISTARQTQHLSRADTGEAFNLLMRGE